MLVTADMRLALGRLTEAAADSSADSSKGVAIEVLACDPWTIQVVHIPVGFLFSHQARMPSIALVVAGLGTIAVHDWRATLLAGQVFSLQVDQRLNASAEGDEPLVLAVLHGAGGEGEVTAPSEPSAKTDGP